MTVIHFLGRVRDALNSWTLQEYNAPLTRALLAPHLLAGDR